MSRPLSDRGRRALFAISIFVIYATLALVAVAVLQARDLAFDTRVQSRSNFVELTLIRHAICPNAPDDDESGVKCLEELDAARDAQMKALAELASGANQKRALHDLCLIAETLGVPRAQIESCEGR